jgi:hypothetical protein
MLIGTETVIGANAVYGGVGLIRDGLGMPSEWLEPTPFGSWVLPGVFLLAVIAAPMFAAAVLESVQSRWAYAGSMFAAACQLGWIIAQVVIIQRYFFLQPVLSAPGCSSERWQCGLTGADGCSRPAQPNGISTGDVP